MTNQDKATLRALAGAAKGWKLNDVQQSDEQKEDGIAVFGGTDEDGNFYDVGTVDTGLYYQPDLAVPLAQFIVSAFAAAVPLLDENERLRAEVEGLRKDAERLDWISNKLFEQKWNGVVDSGSRVSWHIVGNYRHTVQHMHGFNFRSAIDAAIDAMKGQP